MVKLKPTLHRHITDRPADDKKEQRKHNSTYQKSGVSYFADNEVRNKSFVLQMKFSVKNLAFPVALKR